ncbi:PREDICTED: RING finger protein nhl-1 [Nicrophorus vespilloides]|uniref:RING finger protein nhl-1 n=1 Tax=Nicrophorus vespilloides TaxID=110193 RepID=A0ABM1NDA5_NICVS|nr:PREDICTED: RING finger protein nhl-1 [Nicrophorus vespilloides]XP_017784805.1 PREDICTED: RING finger protein nhl-1 [Nicrophorus vespilloides]XP_017784806.1 PREDICTED: RING finger protein nhl-1 [Nicrophorus vespilloides]
MEQFEQLLTCAICLDRYRNPKLLPCQHSFCMEPCMEGLVDYVRRQVKCPECRAEHRIPYQGVQGFPTNVTLQRFLELHIEITGELPDPTSGQIMERCNVCSEKAYCSSCQHCEKKICEECKGAHMDILRREIVRINNQIRRGIHRLQDALSMVEKNAQNVQTNSLSVSEEVEEIYRRLTKAVKDRTEYLRGELDRYMSSEVRTLTNLKDNLELEISNILSNCDLADKHINENVPWDDCELMDAKEIFLKTVDFIRNFEYENSDYSRKVRLVLAHDPNQLVLHVAGYGDLNIVNPSNPFGQGNTLQTPSPGLMRSKSDHRLATQFRQQEERPGYYGEGDDSTPTRKFGERANRTGDRYDRYGRSGNDYGEDYDDSSRPSRSSRYRSRYNRHGENDSDTEQSSRVRFSEQQHKERERVLDTEDVARGPLSGITRLADSPRVMKKLQESESGKKKEKEIPTPVPAPQPPKVVPKRPPPQANRQTSEDDEIAKIKKQNKGATTSTETETRHPSVKRDEPEDRHARKTPAPAEATSSAEESDESASTPQQRKAASKTVTPARRTSAEPPKKATRSTSSDSSSSTDSSNSSNAVRNTGAAYTTEEVKQKYLSRGSVDHTADQPSRTRVSSTSSNSSKDKPFQSRFLSNKTTPTPPPAVTKEEDESDSSSEEETSSESESEEPPPKETKEIAKSDIGPLLARSQLARENSTESTRKTSREETAYTAPRSRYGSQREESPVSKYSTRTRQPAPEEEPPKYGYTSRFLNKSKSTAAVQPEEDDKYSSLDDESKYPTSRSRYMALKERRQRLARSKSSHNFNDDDDPDEPLSPTSTNPSAYLASKGYGSASSAMNDLARSRSSHALKSRENSPDRSAGAEKDGAALSSWARYLKNKYGNRSTGKDKDSASSAATPSSASSSAAARRLSLGLPLRSSTELGSSDDDSKNMQGSPTTPTAATAAAAAGIAVATAGTTPRSQYLLKGQKLFEIGSRGSEAGCFTWPRGVAVGPDNHIVVADSSNHRVQVFDASGKFLKEFGTYGNGEGEFDCLAGVAVNRIGQFIIADRYNHRIQVFDPSGRFLRAFGSQGSSDGRFNYPWGITTDALGFIYVCDKENHRVQVFQSDGTFVGKFGSMGNKQGQLEHPHYIAVSNTNRVVVSDCNNHRIQIFDVNGRVISAFGSEGSAEGQFKFPRGVAVDDQGYICVADSGNNRIQIFHPDGTFLKSFGSWGVRDGEFKGLEGVAISSNGHILVCDRENHRIQVF